MLRRIFRFLGFFLLGLLGLILLLWAGSAAWFAIANSRAKAGLLPKPSLAQDGIRFRDLNANGRLDPYEDPRQPLEARVEDLLGQMSLEEKVGLMWHPAIGIGERGEILDAPNPARAFFSSTSLLLLRDKLRHFNLFTVPDPAAQAKWHNALQRLAEQDRLGIPVTLSTDPRHGAYNFLGGNMLNSGFSKWPEPVGLAALGDSALVAEFGRIAAAEYRAVGIHAALHPMADLATEPRWARINGTFGEDAALAARLTAAYIRGFQGDSLGPASVACMTKHWPGGGPQDDGEDAHFRYGKDQVYPAGKFRYHLIPFEAALEAGTAMMMPYYGVPVGQTPEETGMNFNPYILRDLLRQEYGYEGVICTDWGVLDGLGVLGYEIVPAKNYGVESLSIPERIRKSLEAGVDQFGGNSFPAELLQLVRSGQVSEARIDESARRLLRVKFRLGLFENPYVDENQVASVVARADFVRKGQEVQRRSMVLLKNGDGSPLLPLAPGRKLYVEGLDKAAAAAFGSLADSLADADVAILRLQAPFEPRNSELIETFFHQGDLDFKEPDLGRIRRIMQQKPTIVCLYLDRAAVIPEIARESAALLADFGVSDDALLDVLFGKARPEGRLPFELPASMEAVRAQQEDAPYDSKDPLFPFGFGLSYP